MNEESPKKEPNLNIRNSLICGKEVDLLALAMKSFIALCVLGLAVFFGITFGKLYPYEPRGPLAVRIDNKCIKELFYIVI